MTDELEPIDDSTKVRRKIDNTLARFSAAHDELAAEEAKRKERVGRLTARPAQLLEQTRTKLQRVVAPIKAGNAARAADRSPAAPATPAAADTRAAAAPTGADATRALAAAFAGQAVRPSRAAGDVPAADATRALAATPAADATRTVAVPQSPAAEATGMVAATPGAEATRAATPAAASETADAASATIDGAEATGVVASPEEAKPQTRLQEKKQRKNERSALIGRISLIVLAVLVFLGTGAAWGTKTWFNSKFTEIAALDENSADIQNALAQTGDENFLIAGSDTRAGATAEENVGSADDVEGARSDTVMLAHVPADRKRAVVISFPRDLEITRPSCNRFDSVTNAYTDQVVPAATKVKLNTAYAVGGPRCLTKWIQQLTGLKINHFVGVDFSGFKDMVDAVGGVTVHVAQPIKDTVLGTVVSQTGDVTISGDQALSFVRARHVIGDPTSDYGRIKRQQDFIGALLTKVMSHGVLTNPTQLTDFVNAFARATFGDNIGVDQLLTLAQSMKGLDASKVNFMTVPTTGEANSRGNEVLEDTRAKALFQALINNTALPGSTPAPTSPSAQASARTSSTATKSDQ